MRVTDKERSKAVEKAASRMLRPYREGPFMQPHNGQYREVVVECSLYPKPKFWIVTDAGRSELTPEVWDQLSALKL